MKITSNFLFLTIMIGLTLLACKKNEETAAISDLDKLRNTENISVKMDSTQAINAITLQKVQDVLDLSTLYLSGIKKRK